MPTSTSASLRRTLDSLKQSAVVHKLQARYSFIVAASVETGAGVNFQEARRWAIPSDDEAKRNLRGRVHPHFLYPEAPHCLWDFEFDDDAILFAMRFGGVLSRNLDVDLWRRRMFVKMRSHL